MTTALLADQSLSRPTLGLDEIRLHPSNPRRNAVADEAMVDSIRAQGINEPLMVAPAADGDGWVLIDGHRRWSGAGQAGLDRVPVNPRHDLTTEAQQIEVMIVTGLQKELLTPVEEAAAYEQLTLIGMDDAAIASATGFGVRRIRDRIKLNALSEQVRSSVHDGQLTLDDAAAFEEFADDPDATTSLLEAIGTPNFRGAVLSLRRLREHQAEQDAQIAVLVEHGGRPVEMVPGTPGSYCFVDDEGRTEHRGAGGLFNFNAPCDEPEGHDAGCLLYVAPTYAYGRVQAMCASPQKHPEWRYHRSDDDSTGATPVDSEWERNRAAREAEQARVDAADAVRREWMTAHFATLFPTKSHQGLAAFARAFGAAEDADNAPGPNASATAVLTHFSTLLVDQIAAYFEAPSWISRPDQVLPRLQMWDWLTGAGYELSDVDREIRARLESRLAGDAD